jgi:HD superfamily phosphohydrolase
MRPSSGGHAATRRAAAGSSARRARELAAVVGPQIFGSIWVRRLARISFLGTLDRHPDSRASTSRLEHSVGVATLGLQVATELGLPMQSLRELVAACLLHDIGHFPLSHSAEAGFEAAIGVGHHRLSEWIVLGNGRIAPSRSLRPALVAAGLDPERIWELIAGGPRGAPSSWASLLSMSINLDTLDGIRRAAQSFGLRAVKLPAVIFAQREGTLWIVPEALSAMDRFWRLKEQVYEKVINRPSNILYEAALSEAVRTAVAPSLLDSVERYDDAAFADGVSAASPTVDEFRQRDRLYRFVTTPAMGYVLSRTRKRYWIDRRVTPGPHGLALADWRKRYQHTKHTAFLVTDAPGEQLYLPATVREAPPEPDL